MKRVVRAVFAVAIAVGCGSMWADIPASAYVQDGLVVQFDGIENAGAGAVHDDAATTWKDLSGNGRDGTLAGVTTWLENGLKIESADAANKSVVSFDGRHSAAFTFDVCLSVSKHYKGNSEGFARIITSADSTDNIEPAMVCNGAKLTSATPYAYGCGIDKPLGTVTYDATVPHTSALMQDGVAKGYFYWYHNGVQTAKYACSATSTGSSTASLANKSSDFSRGLDGIYHAVRIYDRMLTADELLINANLDRVRFEDADPSELTWPDGCRLNVGEGCVEYRLRVRNDAEKGMVTAGGVSISEAYFASGAEVELVATPKPGMKFAYWSGDVPTAKMKDAAVTVTMSAKPLTVKANFVAEDSAVWIVPVDFASVNAALADVRVQDGDTIRIADGTHSDFAHVTDGATGTDCLAAIRRKVIVEGDVDDPSAVVIDCGGTGGVIVDHPDAVFRGCTIFNFIVTSTIAGPALNVVQGLATNLVVNGKGSGAANKVEGFITVGEGATLSDALVFGVDNRNLWGDSKGAVKLAGGTLSHVVISNCYLCGVNLIYAASSNGQRSLVEHCDIVDNYGYYCGGVACSGTDVVDCRFIGNSSHDHLCLRSAKDNVVRRCQFLRNSDTTQSADVIGTYGWNATLTLENCLVAQNELYNGTSVRLQTGQNVVAHLTDVTIADNTSKFGTYAALGGDGQSGYKSKYYLTNVLFDNNLANGSPVDLMPDMKYVEFHFDHCFYRDADPTDGTGSIYGDVHFTDREHGDFSLGTGSACIDAGADPADVDVDLIGTPRPQDGDSDGIARSDIGCYERPFTPVALECALTVAEIGSVVPASASLSVTVTGQRRTGLSYEWMSIADVNGVVTTNSFFGTEPTQVISDLPPGRYSFACRVTNDATPPDVAMDVKDEGYAVRPETVYVSPEGSDEWPYMTPQTAARNFKDACATAGRRMIVLPGVYTGLPTVTDADSCSYVGVLDRAISVEGPADPTVVLVDCGGNGGFLLSHPDARLSGLTVSNFLRTAGSGGAFRVLGGISNVVVRGGANPSVSCKGCVYLGENAFASDLLITNVVHTMWSTPCVYSYGGTLRKATIVGCTNYHYSVTATAGERGTRSRLEDCRFIQNNAYYSPGLNGVNTDVVRTEFRDNVAWQATKDVCASAAILQYSTMTDCAVIGGTGSSAIYVNQDWGRVRTTLRNCLIAGNISRYKATVDIGALTSKLTMINCTVVDNMASDAASAGVGGVVNTDYSYVSYATVENCIFHNNKLGGVEVDLPTGMDSIDLTISNTRFVEAADYPSAGNLADDPRLRTSRKRKYTLRPSSPCIDAGANLDWTRDDRDLAGQPRWIGRAVDMGCYEEPPPQGLMLFAR